MQVERHVHCACPEAREVERDRFGRFLHVHEHAIAGLCTCVDEDGRVDPDLVEEFAVGPEALAVEKERRVESADRGGAEFGGYVQAGLRQHLKRIIDR